MGHVQISDYGKQTQLISNGLESVVSLLFRMLIVPFPIQAEPSTFLWIIMCLSDDM